MLARRTFAAGLAASSWATPAASQTASQPASQTASQTASPILDRIRASGFLRFGVVGGQPPYCWKDLATGEWTGFLVDCARDLASGLGTGIEPVESTWGNAVLDVQSGKVDVFFGLAPTPQRALAVDFTRPLYDNAFALVARSAFTPQGWTDLDDPAIRVAVELGSVYDQSVAELCPKATVLRLRTNNDALLAVQSGRADCQVLVVILALTTLSRNRSAGHLVVPQPLHASPTAAMVAKDADPAWRTTVDTWIANRRAAGQLRALLVANLAKVGVPGTDVPPQLLF